MGLMGLTCSFCQPAQKHGAAASPVRRCALSPTRPLAVSQKKRPPGLQPNGRSCYHATLLCLTVSFLYRHVVTAGLTIPYLDQRLAGAAFAFG